MKPDSDVFFEGKSHSVIRLIVQRTWRGNNSCKKEFDNNHLTWCEKINKENDFRYIHLLNGNLEEKLETLKQIKSNESMRNEERKTCDPVTTC